MGWKSKDVAADGEAGQEAMAVTQAGTRMAQEKLMGRKGKTQIREVGVVPSGRQEPRRVTGLLSEQEKPGQHAGRSQSQTRKGGHGRGSRLALQRGRWRDPPEKEARTKLVK